MAYIISLHHLLSLTLISFFIIISTFSPLAQSLTCTTQKLTSNKLYQNCNDLPTLTSYLHWTYTASNKTLMIAFISSPPSSSGWVSWAPNPTGTGMAGSQALLAYKASNGTVAVKTYKISSYSSIVEGKLDFEVYEKSAEYSGGVMKIYATLGVPESVVSAGGKLNHIWQVGPGMVNGFPAKHDFQQANLAAKGTLDLNTGDSTAAAGGGGVDSRMKKKNIHGVLNAISWGILFPLGAVIARYMRTFESADPAWFYLHVFCQISGYAIGVAGWATGLQLGSQSKGIVYTAHRNIGIALFCIATIQLFALLLRPKKDHKYRLYWNIYHHSVGYGIIILGIINVFKGLDILQPANKWKTLYVIILIVLGGISAFLEAITWIVVYRRKSSNNPSTKPYA